MQYEKINYEVYKDAYDVAKIQQMTDHPELMNVEDMRRLMYGQTFTEEYAKGEIPDQLSMDYWKERSEQIKDESDYEIDPSDFNQEEMIQRLLGEDHGLDPSDYMVDSPQELLLLLAIDSTGDGKTKETAKYVIDVHQEYEYLQRVFPYIMMKRVRQSLIDNTYDCIELEALNGKIVNLYFHVGRRFEVGYKLK